MTSPTDPSVTHRTVAVLIDYVDHLGGGYETQLRAGFEAACREYDLSLLFVAGRPIDSHDPSSAAHNEVYRLVHPDCVDGVVVVSAGLSSFCGREHIRRFCEEYRPLPLCSVGVALPGIPSIVADSRPGIDAVIDHLVRDHGRRRVAFVGGPSKNPDAEARWEVYRQALDRHGLPFESQLVAFEHFTIPGGTVATDAILSRGAQFDALVAANDGLALGAIAALKARRIRVPRDVCVTGFDDLILARFSSPPLTTVRQPLEQMAAIAIRLVVEQLAGRSPAEYTCLPVEIVTRRSCGCHLGGGTLAAGLPTCGAPSATEFLRDHAGRLGQRLARIVSVPGRASSEDVPGLLAALQAELEGEPAAFQVALEELLAKAGDHNECFDDSQAAVSWLRNEFRAAGVTELEELWDATRQTIALANTCSQVQQRVNIEMSYQGLLRCGERLSSVLDLPALKRALAEELPQVPIDNVLIALCGEPGKLEPFFRLQGGQSVDPPAAPLLATRLLSSSAYPVDRRHTSFLLPLTCEAEYLGVAVFQPGSGLGVCGMLREQISGAVKSVALHREIAQQTALHERTDRERAAATERMESLSVMAGGVAHDLNSALSPLVMLPDLMLRQLDELVIDATENGRRLRQHVETIKSAGRRATQTVKDLMTLGGQGRAPKAPLDLNRLVASCLSAEPLLVMHQEEPRVDVTVRLYPQPLVVHASQHHVERAISNLIRNAVESIHLDGLISVTTSQACLTEPRLGHETVAAGDYAVVTVSDTGQGIPPELLGRVFEPFFTKKKLRDSSGSGLGLSIVHGVVKEHQGFVDVASTPGTGTTFTLYFPLSTNSPSVVPDPEP